ncbi:tail fiber protein [Alteromonas sp. ASW11-19]|uniref:Tail fiber protein n=1 Tax=Alteromonas salexigens TaxID=2982530 RepID=A0ABT2VRC5_9ALTE|nr:tail fiber protein [Alteromonas salexigens]MCU7555877.1 tail fiber protein [Alteromonas salexigens]
MNKLTRTFLPLLCLLWQTPSSFAQEPMLGEMRYFAGNFAPRGWAFCDGQLLPISQNTALFSLLGTTYGGDGRTTFGLPDMRGRALIHPGNGPGLSSYRQGQKVGVEETTLTATTMAAHSHTVVASAAPGDSDNAANGVLAAERMYSTRAPNKTLNSATLGEAGTPAPATVPVTNVQPVIAINCIIAMSGIYPSRS